MKKLVTAIVVALIFNFQFSIFNWVSAQGTSPSPDDELTQKIKERLQQTAETGLQQIKLELEAQSNLPQKKAFVGKVTDITDSGFTLEYKSQTNKITVNDDTDYAGNPGSFAKIATDDFLIAMGYVYPEKDYLEAQRVSQVTAPKTPPARQLISGKIEEIDGNTVSLDGKTLTISSSTDFTVPGLEDPAVEDLALDDSLFAIVVLDQNGGIDEANSILVIPGKNNPASLTPTNAPTATDSAQPPAEDDE